MTGVCVREARDGEAGRVAFIHRAARGEAMPWLPVLHTPDEDIAFFSERVFPVQRVLVCEQAGEAVGFAASAQGWLNHLYVLPGYWRGGIGSALLGKVMADADSLQLWTFQGNVRARAFYARHGFIETEWTDGTNNEEGTPDVRMVWRR